MKRPSCSASSLLSFYTLTSSQCDIGRAAHIGLFITQFLHVDTKPMWHSRCLFITQFLHVDTKPMWHSQLLGLFITQFLHVDIKPMWHSHCSALHYLMSTCKNRVMKRPSSGYVTLAWCQRSVMKRRAAAFYTLTPSQCDIAAARSLHYSVFTRWHQANVT